MFPGFSAPLRGAAAGSEGTLKVSGFTIVRNATILDYPVVESIRSILPIVDEYVVLLGRSEDDTKERILSIGSPKIRIVENEWVDAEMKDGLFFGRMTSLALEACTGDWAFYLQADEVIHEDDLPAVEALMRENLGKPGVLGISFRYYQFFGDYGSINPYSYRKAVRIVRNDGTLCSCGDASAFRRKVDPDGTSILDGPAGQVVRSDVRVYHYPWVKDLRTLRKKAEEMHRHFRGSEEAALGDWGLDRTVFKRFRGSHPAVMRERIAQFQSPFPPLPNRWLNPAFWRFLMKHGYKG